MFTMITEKLTIKCSEQLHLSYQECDAVLPFLVARWRAQTTCFSVYIRARFLAEHGGYKQTLNEVTYITPRSQANRQAWAPYGFRRSANSRASRVQHCFLGHSV
jgi:hypothetical protein